MKKRSMFLKVLASVLFGVLLFGLVACGEPPAGPSDTTTSSDGGESSVQNTDVSTNTNTDTDSVSTNTSSEEPVVKPIYEENFDDPSAIALRGGDWYYADEWIRQDGGSKWSNEMTEIRDGNLVLKAQWNEADNRVDCGAVWTKGRMEKVGGYYEARIKFPVTPGLWGAFWLMAGTESNVDGSSADGCEIDIIESIDNDKGAFQSAIHWDGYGPEHQSVSNSLTSPNIYDGEYHTFGFERAGGKYVFYVDGKKVWSTAAAGLCAEPGYLMFSMEGTYSRGVGSTASITALPAEMLVDYVKIYKTKP